MDGTVLLAFVYVGQGKKGFVSLPCLWLDGSVALVRVAVSDLVYSICWC